MKSKLKNTSGIFFLFCISVLIYQFLKADKLKEALLQRGKIVSGRVYEIKEQGSKFNNSVCYIFQIAEGAFKNCKQYRLSGSLEDRLVGIYAPVLYDSTDPNINQILLYESDFQAYKVNYHDSLQWIEDLR